MRLRDFLPTFREESSRSEFTEIVRQVPHKWQPLLHAVLARRAADAITIHTAPEKHLIDLNDSRGIHEAPQQHVIYQRPLGSPVPTSSAGVHGRIDALREALADAGIKAHSEGTMLRRREHAAPIDGVVFGSEELKVDDPNVMVTTHYVAGDLVTGSGERAPSDWQRGKAGPARDYTNAQVTVTLNDRQTMYIRAGESAGTHTALMKALAASQVGLNSSAKPLAVSDAFRDLPHLMTGDAATVLRGQRGPSGYRLDRIEIVVPESHIDALSNTLRRMLTQDAAPNQPLPSPAAMLTRQKKAELQSPTYGRLTVHLIPDNAFAELASKSTSHVIGGIRMAMAPPSPRKTLAVQPEVRHRRDSPSRDLGQTLERTLGFRPPK